MTWTKSEIQSARKIMLLPLLSRRGYKLRMLENGNYLVDNILGKLVIKNNFWFWNDRKCSGNTIDFLITIEKLSFTDAMNILCPKNKPLHHK